MLSMMLDAIISRPGWSIALVLTGGAVTGALSLLEIDHPIDAPPALSVAAPIDEPECTAGTRLCSVEAVEPVIDDNARYVSIDLDGDGVDELVARTHDGTELLVMAQDHTGPIARIPLSRSAECPSAFGVSGGRLYVERYTPAGVTDEVGRDVAVMIDGKPIDHRLVTCTALNIDYYRLDHGALVVTRALIY
jgi:hypothetical protein